MPRPPKLRPDVNEIAFRTVQAAIGEAGKPAPAGSQDNAVAKARGAKGGKKGGPARHAKLSDKRRRQIAKKGAAARWKKDG